jgi:hypothetical protein
VNSVCGRVRSTDARLQAVMLGRFSADLTIGL